MQINLNLLNLDLSCLEGVTPAGTAAEKCTLSCRFMSRSMECEMKDMRKEPFYQLSLHVALMLPTKFRLILTYCSQDGV